MNQILRDECGIIIPHGGPTPYIIERKAIQKDADVQPILEQLMRQPWATEEIRRHVEMLLREWLDQTYQRGRYAPGRLAKAIEALRGLSKTGRIEEHR
jgi:hypothetical protein